MSRNEKIVLFAVLAVVLLGGGTAVVLTQTRGLRNNNPGNIRLGSSAWLGAIVGTDTAFVTFSEMRYGVRAAAKLFRNYQSKYALRTIAQLVSRWAPPSENDTQAYIASVVARVGIDAGAPLDLSNAELCYKFLRAIFRHENGVPAELIPETTLREGIALK